MEGEEEITRGCEGGSSQGAAACHGGAGSRGFKANGGDELRSQLCSAALMHRVRCLA